MTKMDDMALRMASSPNASTIRGERKVELSEMACGMMMLHR